MFVAKIGGKSIARKKNGAVESNLGTICSLVRQRLDERPVLVVSAACNSTDLLEDSALKACSSGDWRECYSELYGLHKTILGQAGIDFSFIEKDMKGIENLFRYESATVRQKEKYLDIAMAYGEMLSAKMIAEYLRQNGINAAAVMSWDVGMITDSIFQNAKPLPGVEDRLKEGIKKYIDKGMLPVITGYIGKDTENNLTTLGRGSSDWSAALIASAIDADAMEFWKDLGGVMRADPNIVPGAEIVSKISYREAEQISYKGSRVLHTRTMAPLRKKNIPTRMTNICGPSRDITEIDNNGDPTGDVKVIVCREGVYRFNIYSPEMADAVGYAADVFRMFKTRDLSVNMISTDETGISLTMTLNGKKEGYEKDNIISSIRWDLEQAGYIANVHKGKAEIAVIGEGMHHKSGIAGRVFGMMGEHGINIEMISQGASELNIGFVVDGKDAHRAVRALYDGYFGKKARNL